MPYAPDVPDSEVALDLPAREPGVAARPVPIGGAYTPDVDAVPATKADAERRELVREIAGLKETLGVERRRAAELFELVPEAYLITDELGIIRECNIAAAQLFGVMRRSLAGKSLASLMDPETRPEFRERIGRLRCGGAQRWRGHLRSREGSATPVIISAAPMRDGDRLEGLRWMVRDDSERSAAQARLLELSAELASHRQPPREDTSYASDAGLGVQPRRRAPETAPSFIDLLGVVSHEIRTPVAAAHGYIDMLRRGLHGELTALQRNDLESIAACHEHLLRVLDNALAVARLDNGHLDLALAQVPVDAAMHALHPYIQPDLLARRIRYAYRGGDPSALVLADRGKLHQIMLNLLTNAVKFTRAGGSVMLSWHATGTAVAMTVTDTGVGIAAADLERVFEPYVRVPARGGDVRGTGLGLAISRRLARAMGGDVTVTSDENVGSTFTLTLPRAGRGEL